MTLAELAGVRLTKGMLSLIENGKAKPSMDSLHYIAEQLNVDISTLVNDNHIEEIRELLLNVEEQFYNIKDPYNKKEIELIEHILKKINVYEDQLLGDNYEEIRLLDLKIRLEALLNIDEFQEDEMYRVIHLYEKIHAYSRLVNCYLFLASVAFNKYDYIKSLRYLQRAEDRIKPYVHLVDHLSKLDLHYLLTVLYSAVGDVLNTEKHLEVALDIAQKHKIYYRLDDFYRFMLVQSMGRHDLEKSYYYITKLKQHAEFTEEPISQFTYMCCKAFYSNIIEKDYNKTIEITKKAKEFASNESGIIIYLLEYIVTEETYALWGLGLYNDALKCSKDFKVTEAVHHPYDLTTMYKCFAVRALCHLELGDREDAKQEILYAANGVKNFPNTIDKTFIDEAYKKIIE